MMETDEDICILCSTEENSVKLEKCGPQYFCPNKDCIYCPEVWRIAKEYDDLVTLKHACGISSVLADCQIADELAELSPLPSHDTSPEEESPVMEASPPPWEKGSTKHYEGIITYQKKPKQMVAPAPNVSKISPLVQNEKRALVSRATDGISSVFENFVIWPNRDALCWLNATLSLLVHSYSIRNFMLSEQTTDCQIAKIFTDYQNILIDANENSASSLALAMMRNQLFSMQEYVFEFLQKNLRCVKGQPDSPVFTIPLLLKEDTAIKDMFEIKHWWTLDCQNCPFQGVFEGIKTVVSFHKVTKDFAMTSPVSLGICKKCLRPDQKKQLNFVKLPQSLIFHFENGLPNRNLMCYDFEFQGQKYRVKGFILYTMVSRQKHFITWIRDIKTNCWLNCDDLQSGFHKLSTECPNIEPSEVHIVMWEQIPAVGEDAFQLNGNLCPESVEMINSEQINSINIVKNNNCDSGSQRQLRKRFKSGASSVASHEVKSASAKAEQGCSSKAPIPDVAVKNSLQLDASSEGADRRLQEVSSDLEAIKKTEMKSSNIENDKVEPAEKNSVDEEDKDATSVFPDIKLPAFEKSACSFASLQKSKSLLPDGLTFGSKREELAKCRKANEEVRVMLQNIFAGHMVPCFNENQLSPLSPSQSEDENRERSVSSSAARKIQNTAVRIRKSSFKVISSEFIEPDGTKIQKFIDCAAVEEGNENESKEVVKDSDSLTTESPKQLNDISEALKELPQVAGEESPTLKLSPATSIESQTSLKEASPSGFSVSSKGASVSLEKSPISVMSNDGVTEPLTDGSTSPLSPPRQTSRFNVTQPKVVLKPISRRARRKLWSKRKKRNGTLENCSSDGEADEINTGKELTKQTDDSFTCSLNETQKANCNTEPVPQEHPTESQPQIETSQNNVSDKNMKRPKTAGVQVDHTNTSVHDSAKNSSYEIATPKKSRLEETENISEPINAGIENSGVEEMENNDVSVPVDVLTNGNKNAEKLVTQSSDEGNLVNSISKTGEISSPSKVTTCRKASSMLRSASIIDLCNKLYKDAKDKFQNANLADAKSTKNEKLQNLGTASPALTKGVDTKQMKGKPVPAKEPSPVKVNQEPKGKSTPKTAKNRSTAKYNLRGKPKVSSMGKAKRQKQDKEDISDGAGNNDWMLLTSDDDEEEEVGADLSDPERKNFLFVKKKEKKGSKKSGKAAPSKPLPSPIKKKSPASAAKKKKKKRGAHEAKKVPVTPAATDKLEKEAPSPSKSQSTNDILRLCIANSKAVVNERMKHVKLIPQAQSKLTEDKLPKSGASEVTSITKSVSFPKKQPVNNKTEAPIVPNQLHPSVIIPSCGALSLNSQVISGINTCGITNVLNVSSPENVSRQSPLILLPFSSTGTNVLSTGTPIMSTNSANMQHILTSSSASQTPISHLAQNQILLLPQSAFQGDCKTQLLLTLANTDGTHASQQSKFQVGNCTVEKIEVSPVVSNATQNTASVAYSSADSKRQTSRVRTAQNAREALTKAQATIDSKNSRRQIKGANEQEHVVFGIDSTGVLTRKTINIENSPSIIRKVCAIDTKVAGSPTAQSSLFSQNRPITGALRLGSGVTLTPINRAHTITCASSQSESVAEIRNFITKMEQPKLITQVENASELDNKLSTSSASNPAAAAQQKRKVEPEATSSIDSEKKRRRPALRIRAIPQTVKRGVSKNPGHMVLVKQEPVTPSPEQHGRPSTAPGAMEAVNVKETKSLHNKPNSGASITYEDFMLTSSKTLSRLWEDDKKDSAS